MKRLLHNLFGQSSPAREHRVRPQVEALEDRQLLSITDMTGVAQLFPRHAGPTMLYLNFDGWAANGVSSFQSTTGDRVKDIHDILFRSSEIFAPFDVEVRRRYGDGSYDSSASGNSTLFIGDKTSNGTGASNKAYAGTPWVYADFPGDVHGIDHRPNSDPFDLAYVDPISAGGSWTNLQIARAIGHEAGHTFGLGHVLSSPDKEMMSYDASNVRFINKTFNITDLNYNGTTTAPDPDHAPKWHDDINFIFFTLQVPVKITTQNSYTFLQTVLGSRSTAGDFGNVADATAVDATYTDGSRPNITVGSSYTASVGRPGDFDVFQLSTAASQKVVIDVTQYSGSTVDPVLFIYDSTGLTLKAFNDDRAPGDRNSKLIFQTTAGVQYKVVVGSYGANSTGSYRIAVSNYSILVYDPVLLLKTTTLVTYDVMLTSSMSGAGMGSAAMGAFRIPGRGNGASLSDAMIREVARGMAQRSSVLGAAIQMALEKDLLP